MKDLRLMVKGLIAGQGQIVRCAHVCIFCYKSKINVDNLECWISFLIWNVIPSEKMFLKRSDFPNRHGFEFTVRPLDVSASHRGTPSHHRFLPGIKTLAMAFALLFAVLYETERHGTGRFRSLGNMDNTDIIMDELCCVMLQGGFKYVKLGCFNSSCDHFSCTCARTHLWHVSTFYSVMLRYYWKHMWCCIGV